jgi:hypothetical protein
MTRLLSGVLVLLLAGVAWAAQPILDNNAESLSVPHVQILPNGEIVGGGAALSLHSGAYVEDPGYRMHDDFVGIYQVISGTNSGTYETAPVYPGWVKIASGAAGSPTALLVASGKNGLLRLTLTATDEAQVVSVFKNNQCVYNIATGQGGVVFESRVQMSTNATVGARAFIGLAGNYHPRTAIDTAGILIPKNVAGFQISAGGTLYGTQLTVFACNSGSAASRNVATGITWTGTATTALDAKRPWLRLRVDASNPGDVQFFVKQDGQGWQRVAGSTMFNMQAALVSGVNASDQFQPYLSVLKEGTIGTAVLDVDSVDVQVIGRR